jgi:hypothetical protein
MENGYETEIKSFGKCLVPKILKKEQPRFRKRKAVLLENNNKKITTPKHKTIVTNLF